MKTFNIKKLPIEIKLLSAICALSGFVLLMRFLNIEAYRTIIENFALFSDLKIFNFRIWQFATYSFLHGDILHLLFNMVMLYLFSQLFFTFFNQKQFLKAYFFGGVASGIFYFLVSNVFGMQNYIVGASGAIMAVFFTVVGYNPNMRVNVIIFGNIAIYYIAFAFLGFDLLQLFFDNAGGHLAHIGGSVFGFLYGKSLAGSTFGLKLRKQKKNSLRTVHKIKHTNNKIAVDEVQKQIDVILDKIGKSGYDSLTQEEKEFLFKQK